MSDEEEISVYDEVEIEDMTYDEALQTYFYPCPCGDRFQIALGDLQDEETDIAVCPSCSLMIRVIYEVVSQLLHSSGLWSSSMDEKGEAELGRVAHAYRRHERRESQTFLGVGTCLLTTA